MFAERFMEQGWLRIDRLFPRELIDAARAEYERQSAELVEHRGGHRNYLHADGDERRHIVSPRLNGRLLDPLLWAHPIVIGLLRAILGLDLLIDNLTIVTAYPGARDQRVHRDHAFLFPEAPDLRGSVPPYAVTLVIPLTDLSEATGSTRLYPGSHRGEIGEDSLLPIVARGDCFLMDFRLAHLGTANRSDEVRPMLFIVYARPWFIDLPNLRRQERIRITRDDLARVAPAQWPLFRRLAAKGGFDVSERELFPKDEAAGEAGRSGDQIRPARGLDGSA